MTVKVRFLYHIGKMCVTGLTGLVDVCDGHVFTACGNFIKSSSVAVKHYKFTLILGGPLK
jgi:hypothetical protein